MNGEGRAARLGELAVLFLRLGVLGFGGPAAHVALMEEEVVRRRGWIDRETFLDLYGATQLIPGPNSTELAIHIGRERAGLLGLLVAGVCFVAPAAAIVTAIAWAYVRFGALAPIQGILWGVKPVMIVVVTQALVRLGSTALKTRVLALVAAGALAGSLAGANELGLLLVCGIGVAAVRFPRGAAAAAVGAAAGVPAAATAAPFALGALFLFFLKVGSVLFGSGYVLLAFLRADLVVRLQWLTEPQLLDAIAVGQVTPGPVFTTATFVGYLLGGTAGALVATIGIFLPGFVFVALSGSLLPRLRRSAAAGAFLDGVNAASLALMAAVTLRLAGSAVVDIAGGMIALGAAALLFGTTISSAWLLAGAAAIGWAIG